MWRSDRSLDGAVVRIWLPAERRAQEGFEQFSVERVAIEQKFGMPLDAEKEAMGR